MQKTLCVQVTTYFPICKARGRNSRVWDPKQYTFQQFFLATDSPYVRPEKDGPGFFGGELSGRRRTRENVISRTVIALDYDHLPAGTDRNSVVAAIPEDWAFVAYTTFSHSLTEPRWRVLLFPERPLAPDEYERWARYAAHRIDLGDPDPNSFSPTQFMYLPAHPPGGEDVYRTAVRDAGPTPEPPDDFRPVATYERHREAGDPRDKPGVIGAFCRAYTVPEAIDEFLDNVYSPTRSRGRFVHADASGGEGGLVVYDEFDDATAYSFHENKDRASGVLLNAYDLVRIHKFGGEPGIADKASEREMNRWAMTLPGVFEQITQFFDPVNGDVPDDWRAQLTVDRSGVVKKTPANYRLIVENDAELMGAVGFDVLTGRLTAFEHRDWLFTPAGSKYPRDWSDLDDAALNTYLFDNYGIEGRPSALASYVESEWIRNRVDRLTERVYAAEWDGVERVETAFVTHLDAEDTPYVRAVTAYWFKGLIARALDPGCEFHLMIMLAGPQGSGKSSFAKAIAGPGMYRSHVPFDNDKVAREKLTGAWVVESAELAGIVGKRLEDVKNFLTSSRIVSRASYGRHTTTLEKRNVYIGTTNEEAFLRDRTGNRRFAVVKCGEANPDRPLVTEEIALQLIAEARERYLADPDLTVPREITDQQAERNAEFADTETGWEEPLDSYLNAPVESGSLPEGYEVEGPDGLTYRKYANGAELWAVVRQQLGGLENLPGKNRHLLNETVGSLGWTKKTKKTRVGSGNVRVYHRVTFPST